MYMPASIFVSAGFPSTDDGSRTVIRLTHTGGSQASGVGGGVSVGDMQTRPGVASMMHRMCLLSGGFPPVLLAVSSC